MLTRSGWCLLAGASALGVAGWWLGYPELAVVATGGFLALATAVAWTRGRPRLHLERRVHPTVVTCGDSVEGIVTVTNRARTTSPNLVATEAFGAGSVGFDIPRLVPGSETELRWRMPTDRRGVVRVGPITVSRVDPLGLAHRRQRHARTVTVSVLPRVHPIAPLPAGQERSLEGPTVDTAPKGSITFHALREYEPGDDLRYIHWRSTAKTGTLMMRQHVDTPQPRASIVLDTRAAVYDPIAFEQAVEVVASIAVASAERNFPIRLFTSQGLAGSGRGGRDLVHAVLEQLSEVAPTDDADLAQLGAIGAGSGSSLAVVTGRVTAEDAAVIGAIRQGFDLTVVVPVRRDRSIPLPQIARTIVLDVSSAAEFASRWNRLVRA